MPTFDRQTLANAEQTQNRRNVYTFSKNFNSTVTNGAVTQWTSTGIPGAGVNTGGVAYTGAQCLSTTAGAVYFDAAPTNHKRFLRAVTALNSAGFNGTLIVLDRLVQFPGVNHATIGTTGIVYDPGLPRYTTGVGVMAFLEVTTGLNAVAHTVQLTYTDQGGNSSTTSAMTPIASSTATRIPFASLYFSLGTGDTGVRGVTNVIVASGGAPTGTSCLVLAKPICEVPIVGLSGSATAGRVDLLDKEMDLPQIEDGACLMFITIASGVFSAPDVRGTLRSFLAKTS